MNINRHNYEEFFLLYADGELNAADRKALELFVQQNPDLKPELDLLMQTVLPADTFSYNNKTNLIKIEPGQQELLLHYLDGELTIPGTNAAEKLIISNKAVSKEWELLQKTRLPDETVVFTGKESLYKNTGGRVVALRWMRSAAAVLLLGVAGWLVYSTLQNGKTPPETVTNNPVENTNNIAQENNVQENNSNTNIVNTNMLPEIKTGGGVADNKTNRQAYKQPENPLQQKNVVILPAKKDMPVVIKEDKKPDNNLPVPALQNFNKDERNETIAVNVQPSNSDNLNSGIAAAAKNNGDNQETNIVKPTVYYPDKDNGGSENRFLYAKEETIKRSKLGGFFKKVKRMVERTANIKPGNSIKIANIELTSL